MGWIQQKLFFTHQQNRATDTDARHRPKRNSLLIGCHQLFLIPDADTPPLCEGVTIGKVRTAINVSPER